MLAVGIIGTPILGVFNDSHTVSNVKSVSEEIHIAAKSDASFFGASYESIDRAKATELAAEQGLTDELLDAMNGASRQSLRTTAISFPLVMLIAFGFIALYYRKMGGYHPIELQRASSNS